MRYFRILSVVLLTVATLFIALLQLIFELIWRIITYPYRLLKEFRKSISIAQFIIDNKGRKILIYNYTNYKMVETYLLPLLDRSFVIYFISKEGIDSSIKEKSVRTFLKYSELNGGYPHLIKVADKGYYNKSLKKVVSELKNGRISTVYVQSMIKFFFENDDMNFDF